MSRDDAAKIRSTMKKAAAVLRDSGHPFALGGSLAVWAHGGPVVSHDIDFIIREEDNEAVLAVLQQAGFRPERPPEEWLFKVYDGDCLVDLIFRAPLGSTKTYMDDAEELVIDSVRMPVMKVDDVLLMKLGAMSELYMDYAAALQIARSCREQLSWEYIERETKGSPFAEAFFVLCDGLGIRQRA